MKLNIFAVTALSLGIMSGAALADAGGNSGQGFSPDTATATTYVDGSGTTRHSITGFNLNPNARSAGGLNADGSQGLSLQCQQEANRGSSATASC